MPAEWLTPNAYIKNRAQVYAKIENYKPTVELDLDKEISYFGYPRAASSCVAYDQFFAYTKTFPLYDPRKERENRKYLPCVRETIFQQEWPKPVPALVSMNYGKRTCYDKLISNGHNHSPHIGNFYRRRGEVMPTPEKSKLMEDVEFSL